MKKIDKFITASIILALILLFPLSCLSQEEKQNDSTESKFGSLQKSLLIPGWGQIAEKRYAEGILFLTSEIFCLYKILSYNHKSNEYYHLYKDANNVDDAIKYRELTEKYDIRRNTFLLVAAGIWAVNLIDIYVIVKNKQKKERNLKLKLESGKNKVLAFTVSYSF